MKLESNMIRNAHVFKTLSEFISKNALPVDTFYNIFSANSISEFIENINEVSESISFIDYEFGISEEDGTKKFKGDMWELFTMFFINFYGGDREILIHNLEWSSRNEIGIDFIAKNPDDKVLSVQSKFVGSEFTPFDRNRLETFFMKSTPGLRVLFTSANINKIDALYKRSHYEKELKIIDRSLIKLYVDNKPAFWNDCFTIYKEVLEYLTD